MNWPPWAQTTQEQTALCPAVCTTHQQSCNYHLKPQDEHARGDWHICQYGGIPHEFYEATHDTPTPILG